MSDILLAGIILLAVGAAVISIAKAKRRGVKCIGCPAGGNCAGKKGGCGNHFSSGEE